MSLSKAGFCGYRGDEQYYALLKVRIVGHESNGVVAESDAPSRIVSGPYCDTGSDESYDLVAEIFEITAFSFTWDLGTTVQCRALCHWFQESIWGAQRTWDIAIQGGSPR